MTQLSSLMNALRAKYRTRKISASKCELASKPHSGPVNDEGGVNGGVLRLISADDGYEPARTAETMKQLYEKDQVFGFIGNVGTPTAMVSAPFVARAGAAYPPNRRLSNRLLQGR
jgi:hypothetical protein